MWIVKMIFWVAVMLLIIFFVSANTVQEAQVMFWKWESQPMPLWLLMFISFATGVVVSLAIAIFKLAQFRGDGRKLRKENQKMTLELTELRSASIENDIKIENSPPLPGETRKLAPPTDQ